MVFVMDHWSFYGGDSCSMGEMLVEARKSCVFGCITCSRISVFSEEEEAIKSLISSSSYLSLMDKY
jgi:hypothetical protein